MRALDDAMVAVEAEFGRPILGVLAHLDRLLLRDGLRGGAQQVRKLLAKRAERLGRELAALTQVTARYRYGDHKEMRMLVQQL